jgi:hypothetical protein
MPIPAGGDSELPDWAPTLDEVAAYCTARTLVPQSHGSNLEKPAFDSTTRPTADLVTLLIADAVAWVLLKTGDLDTTLNDAARSVSCQRTAGLIELRFPERQSANRDDAITTAKELLKQADQMRTDLTARNESVTGEDPDDPGGVFGTLPVWSFPRPPADCAPW